MSDGPGSDFGAAALNLERHSLPFMPVSLHKDGVELNLFTTIATLGTPAM
jgi:hypothetical protein